MEFVQQQLGSFPLSVQMFINEYVSMAVMVGYFVVEWVHHWACLFWCAAFLLLSISQGLGGTQRGHMTGPCKAELVTPIVPQQTHPFGVLLCLHCKRTPQYCSRHGNKPDVPQHVS